MKIGVDIDEVLADFLNSFINYHNDTYFTKFSKKDFKTYELSDTLGGKKIDAINKIYEFYNTVNFKNILPLEKSEYAINKLSKDNSLRVITSRPYKIHNETISWLDKHFQDSFKEIHFTNEWVKENGVISKKDVCVKYGLDFLIEDSLNYARECKVKNTKIILMDQPWNHKVKEDNKIIRVNTWEEILDFFEKFK